MKIEHKKAASPFNDLQTFQKTTFKVAVMLAFAGIFVWFIKIIFF